MLQDFMENAIGGVVTRASKDANAPGKDDLWVLRAPCSGLGKLGRQGTLGKMGKRKVWFWPLQVLALRLVLLYNIHTKTRIPDRTILTCA